MTSSTQNNPCFWMPTARMLLPLPKPTSPRSGYSKQLSSGKGEIPFQARSARLRLAIRGSTARVACSTATSRSSFDVLPDRFISGANDPRKCLDLVSQIGNSQVLALDILSLQVGVHFTVSATLLNLTNLHGCFTKAPLILGTQRIDLWEHVIPLFFQMHVTSPKCPGG